MKKLQDNLAARIAASVILTVSFLLTLLSTAGIVLLASYRAYNDGGAQLRTSYLHAAGVQEYYDHVEPVLEGLVHEPQSYQNYLNSLNVHVDVKTTDGTTVFSNAKEGETSLLEGPFSYTFTTGETKLWKNTFSDAEKAQRALERFPYQIEDYEIEASPFEYSTSYSPIDESLGDALDETLSGLESYYPMLKIWYYPEGSLTEVEVGVTLAAAPIGNDSVAVTARWIDLLIAMRVWLILILVLSAACCVASFAFRLRTAGHKRGTAGITLRWLDRMPFEVYLLALAAVVLIIVFSCQCKGGAVVDRTGRCPPLLSASDPPHDDRRTLQGAHHVAQYAAAPSAGLHPRRAAAACGGDPARDAEAPARLDGSRVLAGP